MAKFAANTLKAKKAAIMLDFNSPYSRGLTEFFEAAFKKLGGQIVNQQSYTQGDRDYKGQLTAIRSQIDTADAALLKARAELRNQHNERDRATLKLAKAEQEFAKVDPGARWATPPRPCRWCHVSLRRT